MTFMRARGLAMPLHWCGNGSLVPPAIEDLVIYPVWGPLYQAGTLEEAQGWLEDASALAVTHDRLQVGGRTNSLHLRRHQLASLVMPLMRS